MYHVSMPDKPKVTDAHLKKYEAIMGTPIGSRTTSPTGVKSPIATGPKNPFASFIPRPTGLGNKMFIFTGKKKIIIDGAEREVEKVKTVNPTPKPYSPPANIEKVNAVTHAPFKKLSSIPSAITAPTAKDKHEKQEKKTSNKIPSVPSGSKKIPLAMIVVLSCVFIVAWTLFWLVFFGFVKL